MRLTLEKLCTFSTMKKSTSSRIHLSEFLSPEKRVSALSGFLFFTQQAINRQTEKGGLVKRIKRMCIAPRKDAKGLMLEHLVSAPVILN